MRICRSDPSQYAALILTMCISNFSSRVSKLPPPPQKKKKEKREKKLAQMKAYFQWFTLINNGHMISDKCRKPRNRLPSLIISVLYNNGCAGDLPYSCPQKTGRK